MSTRQLDGGALRAWLRRLGSSTTGTARVWALTVVLGAIALVLATIELPAGQLAQAPVAVPWWLLAGLFYLTEAKVVHLHLGRSAHSFSMSEIPVVYGIFFFRPAEFIVARLIGAGLALVIGRRQRSVKLGFNLAQFLFCSVITVGVVHLLVAVGGAFGPREWPAAFLATSAENMVGVFAVTAAISLAEGAPQHARIPRMLLMGAVTLVVCARFVPVWAAVLAAVGAAYAPYAYIVHRRDKRFQKFRDNFPDVLDSLARALRAGYPLSAAMEMIAAETTPPVSVEMRRTSAEANLGRGWPHALESLARRVPVIGGATGERP